MILDEHTLERGLLLFEALIDEVEDHTRALEASRERFGPATGHRTGDWGAGRRHLEWFLFESGGAEALLGAWRERADPELEAHAACFLESEVGLFVVEEVRPDGTAALEDVAGLGTFLLAESAPEGDVSVGDLIVGRLYPLGDGRHRPSPAARTLRSPQLLTALRRDLSRLREENDQAVLRISQAELESMFFGPGPGPGGGPGGIEAAREQAERDALACLVAGGVEDSEAAELVAAFRSMAYDPLVLTPGADDPLAAVLERLAFESEVDLERARVLLLALWTQPVSQPTEVNPSTPTPAHADAARALEEFDRARRAGLDVDSSIAALERQLGLDQLDEDEEPEREAPDFPGVVAAMIEEFLWDVAREEGPDTAATLDSVRLLGEYAGHVGVFENLGSRDLLTFCAFWVLERGGLADAAAARRLLDAVGRFCVWAEEHHEVRLSSTFSKGLAELALSLPRIVTANGLLPEPAEGAAGEVWEVVGVEGPAVRLAGPDGAEQRAAVRADLAAHLASGDTLRAEVDPAGGVRVHRCYPPQAKALWPARSAGGERN
ncbi:MAG: hypothetical protein QF410_12100 [Planctomycetota bacterium]|nr:hypothetical protein [Planctomycetota bacterium]